MNRTFVELPSFLTGWKRLGLNDEHLRKLEMELLIDSTAGDVIDGTGGIRKMRFALPGRGKSGSSRVIYVDFAVYEKIYLLTVYAKSDQGNLTKGERNGLKALVEILGKQLKERG